MKFQVKYLLGQTQVNSCEEEKEWFDLEKALDEIAGFAIVYENINSVKTAISDHMYSTISDENCFLLHKKFTEYDCRTHSEKTLKYIKYNLVRMVLDSCVDVEFFRLSVEDVEQLLNSPDLNLEKEVHVAEVVNKWISADRAKREIFRPKLLSTVRLFALSEQVYLLEPPNCEFIFRPPECSPTIVFRWTIHARPVTCSF